VAIVRHRFHDLHAKRVEQSAQREWGKRFGKNAICSCFVAALKVQRIDKGCQHHDDSIMEFRSSFNTLADLRSRHLRKAKIKKDDRRMLALDDIQRTCAVTCFEDLPTGARHGAGDERPNARIVFDDQQFDQQPSPAIGVPVPACPSHSTPNSPPSAADFIRVTYSGITLSRRVTIYGKRPGKVPVVSRHSSLAAARSAGSEADCLTNPYLSRTEDPLMA